jgi:hypothetical protein
MGLRVFVVIRRTPFTGGAEALTGRWRGRMAGRDARDLVLKVRKF